MGDLTKIFTIPTTMVSTIGECSAVCEDALGSGGRLACPKDMVEWNGLSQAEASRSDEGVDRVGSTGAAFTGAYMPESGVWECADGDPVFVGAWEKGQPDGGSEMCDVVELCTHVTFDAEKLEFNDIACDLTGTGSRSYVVTSSRCACEAVVGGGEGDSSTLDVETLMAKSPDGITYDGCVSQYGMIVAAIIVGVALFVIVSWCLVLRFVTRRMIRKMDEVDAESNLHEIQRNTSGSIGAEGRFAGRRASIGARHDRAESVGIDELPLPGKLDFGDTTLYAKYKVVIGVLMIMGLTSVMLTPWYDGDICPLDDQKAKYLGGELTIVSTTTRSVKYSTSMVTPYASEAILPGDKVPAPRFFTAGTPIPNEGVEGDLYFIENLCDPELSCSTEIGTIGCVRTPTTEVNLLDCNHSPIRVNPDWKGSLKGKMLILDMTQDARLFKNGWHRLSLLLEPLEPAAILWGQRFGHLPFLMPYLPGMFPRWHAVGEETWDGVDGNPNNATRVNFPVADINSAEAQPLITAASLRNHTLGAKLTPTLANPYRASFCGNWVVLRLVCIILYLSNFEKALQSLSRHIELSGVQVWSFAQNMLLVETLLPLLASLGYLDPAMSWYYGIADMGTSHSGNMGASLMSSCSALLLAGYWMQMVKSNGLSNFTARTTIGKYCIVFSQVVVAIVLYSFICEATLWQHVWQKMRISGFNSHHFRYALVTSIAFCFFTSLYFISSTLVAHVVLAHDKHVSNTKKAVLRALMRRILLSGCLMALIFSLSTVSVYIYFNPVGYVLSQGLLALLQVGHSRFQIDSFTPVGGIKAGPMRAALGYVEVKAWLVWRLLTCAAKAEAKEKEKVITVLRTVGTALARIADPKRRSIRKSVALTLKRVTLELSIEDVARKMSGLHIPNSLSKPAMPSLAEAERESSLARMTGEGLGENGSELGLELAATNHGKGEEEKLDWMMKNPIQLLAEETRRRTMSGGTNGDVESQSGPKRIPKRKKERPWELPGLSVALLDALVSAYDIDSTWNLVRVKDEIIIPGTKYKRCTYVEALDEHPHKREGWLGKPGYFVSHWWGYSFLQLVEMIRLHSEKLKREGINETPFYFIDAFTVNQHTVALGSTNDKQTYLDLVAGLRKSLISCGTLVVCCAEGGEGLPGWECPAPTGRIWCLFEIYQAIQAKVNVTVQLAPHCESDFRMALHHDGLTRVEDALAEIDAEHAMASVESDRVMILEDIRSQVGVEKFNRAIRRFLKLEFRSIATKETLHKTN